MICTCFYCFYPGQEVKCQDLASTVSWNLGVVCSSRKDYFFFQTTQQNPILKDEPL